MSAPAVELPPPHLRWNLTMMGLDIALFVAATSFTAWNTILPLYMRHLGASDLVVGLMPAVRNLGFYVPPIFVSPTIRRLARYKPYVLWCTTLERVPYLILAIATVALWPRHPTVLLLLSFLMVAIWSTAGGVATSAWLQWVARVVPTRLRGRFFGISSGVGGLLGVAGAASAALILRVFTFPTSFVLCFLATATLLALSFVGLSLGRELPGRVARADTGERMLAYLRTLPSFLRRERNFARFLLANVLGNVGVAVSPFLAVAASRNAHVTDAQIGIYGSVLLAISTLGSFGWGWLGDRSGYRLVLLAGTLAGCVCLSLAAVASSLGSAGWFYAVFVALGAYSSALQLAAFAAITEFGDEVERPTFIALSSLVLAPVALGAPVVGGAVGDSLGLGAVFVTTALVLSVSCILYVVAVRDPRAGHNKPHMNASEPPA